jgi:hypothetical protein
LFWWVSVVFKQSRPQFNPAAQEEIACDEP